MKHRKQITITIDTSNAAFDDCEQGEVSRILRNLCRDIAHGIPCPSIRPLHDLNGNSIGNIAIERIQNTNAEHLASA